MNPLIQLKTTTLPFLATCVLACLGLSPTARAVKPPPDGGYAGENTAEGRQALFSLTTGTDNTAMGFDALFSNTTGGNNTAVGVQALSSNVASNDNTAVGSQALHNNTTGGANTAVGDLALFSNTTATGNTAIGDLALFANTTGIQNTAIGPAALGNNTGSGNIAIGVNAGVNLTTGDSNIDIGNSGGSGESSTIRIGVQGIGTQGTQTATFIAGITGTTVVGDAVFVTSDGQLGVGGVATSSARFKDEIKPMDKTSEAILALKPVTFRYKKELDPKGTPQFGLVAEEVEKVNPDLITRDRDGKPYTVRYEVVNAMLLNEFLKEHRQVQDQQKEIDGLKAQLKEQRALLQKVSDKMELTKPSPQLVADNH